MPTVNNRRLLPLNGVMPMDAPGGDKDPNKENRKPTDNEVPQNEPQEESDPSDGDDEEESSDSSEDSSVSSSSTFNGENLMLWTKETLCTSLKFASKKYNKLKAKCEDLLDRNDKLVSESTKTKVKHQVTLTSKTTTIANLRNQLKLQAKSKSAVRATFEKKYREDLDLLQSKNSGLRKQKQDLVRDLNKAQKDAKQFSNEKDIAKRKLTDLRLDFVDKTKEATALKNENKRLKKDLDRKTDALAKYDQAKLDAKVEVERQRTERKKLEDAKYLKKADLEKEKEEEKYKKKLDLEREKSEIRIGLSFPSIHVITIILISKLHRNDTLSNPFIFNFSTF